MKKEFTISGYKIDHSSENTLRLNHPDHLNWPLVYLLKDEKTKEAYVGETTDVLTRLKTHTKTEKKEHFSSVNIILSDLFNKSATLDIESHLIRYMAADGKYSLQNGNLGIANHKYYNQKEVYWNLFKGIWDELRSLGISRHSLENIDNSDLFKYSPYKSLSKEQIAGLKTILNCLLDKQAEVSLIQGGAGTGKSILAIFLFKLLKSNLEDFNYADFDEDDEELFILVKEVKEKYGDLNMALVIPMSSFRQTIANVFKNIKGLSKKMVIGPSEIVNQKYDLLIVDEAHRLRRRVNLGPYFHVFDKNCEILGLDKDHDSELDWVTMQAEKTILFYDSNQTIKPSDTTIDSFNLLKELPTTRLEHLQTQYRVKGGNEYVKFIHNLFHINETKSIMPFIKSEYELILFDDLNLMVQKIHQKEVIEGLARMVAGFAWTWISKKNKNAFDIVINDVQLRWNSTAIDWVNSKNAINEVGCIHTTQGYDLNYTGIIIGPELDYDFDNNKLVVYRDRYKDKNGKNTISDEVQLLEYIINIYKTILLRGIKGTYLYVCNANLKKYLSQYISLYTYNLTTKPIKFFEQTASNRIPFFDLELAANSFSNYQLNENLQFIEVLDIENLDGYFACKMLGESMNKIIPNGSICLFKKHIGDSINGLITLIKTSSIQNKELGIQYTIKEYLSKKQSSEDGCQQHETHLISKSNDSAFETIILRDEETLDLNVIGEFIRIL